MSKIDLFKPGLNFIVSIRNSCFKQITNLFKNKNELFYFRASKNAFFDYDYYEFLLYYMKKHLRKLAIIDTGEYKCLDTHDSRISTIANEIKNSGITVILISYSSYFGIYGFYQPYGNQFLNCCTSIMSFDPFIKKCRVVKSSNIEPGKYFYLFQLKDDYKPVKTVFISQPMHGKTEEEVYKVRESVKQKLKSILDEDFELLDTYHQDDAPEDAGRLFYLGGSIRAMDKADLVYFTADFMSAKGCKIEFKIAKKYGIDYIIEDNKET